MVDPVVGSPAAGLSSSPIDDGAAACGSLRSEARALARALASFVGRVDSAAAAGGLSGADAAGLAAVFSEVARLAAAGTTVAAGRVATSGQYRALGFPTAARWLAELSSDGVRAAGRVLTTAAHLDDDRLAATRAAFVGGALTSTQAEELAKTAASAPEEEARLLAFAGRETTKRLREECRRVRLAGRPGGPKPKPRPGRVAEEMAFGARDLGNGMGELFARMPSSWLVRVTAAVREQCEAIFRRARAEGRDDPHAAYLVEALVALVLFGDVTGTGTGGGGPDVATAVDADPADDADGSDAPPTDGVDGGPTSGSVFDDPLYRELLAAVTDEEPPAPPPRSVRRRRCACGGRVVPRAKIIVRVDQSALLRGWTEGDETCDIAGVGPVPVATVRELWPDAVVKLVVTRGVDVVNVTSLGRRATEDMVTAMQWESASRCSNGACDNERFVQVDHRLGWANVRRTRVDELDGLCCECHRLKTNENWQLVRGRGRRRLVPPEDPDHPGDPPTPRRRA